MKYNVKKIPKHPKGTSSSLVDLIYIGQGTNPSIADNYNNGEDFEAYATMGLHYDIDRHSVNNFAILSGSNTEAYYFVKKDAPILPKMFPLPKPKLKKSKQQTPLLSNKDIDFLEFLSYTTVKSEDYLDKLQSIIVKVVPDTSIPQKLIKKQPDEDILL